MSLLKFARNAATVAAAALLPAQAIAATPVSAAFDQLRAGATLEEENGQFGEYNDYLVPVVIVVALGLGIYFILDSYDDSDLDIPTSP
jgi:hypothetical protein